MPSVSRAVVLLTVAVVAGMLLALALRGGGPGDTGSTVLAPGAAAGHGADPLRYAPGLRADREARAAAGLAHVLYAKSPGGAIATARRVDRLRPAIERAARGDGVDPRVLEGIVFLESGGRADARASDDLRGAVGLTQILAQTATGLLGMHVDLATSTRLTREIARGRPARARAALRRRADERFDPARALAGTVRYLDIARRALGGSRELAIVSYHMGIGNVQTVLRRYGRPAPYAEIFFGSSPVDHAAAYRFLAGLGDDSSTYLWRVRAAESIMAAFRADPARLAARAALQTRKGSAEEVLHPRGSVPEYADPFALGRAEAAHALVRLDGALLARYGLAVSPAMGELATRVRQSPRLYRALRPEALAVLLYLGAAARSISKGGPLTVTSTIRDRPYQGLLSASNPEATRGYSLHTTGFAFDIARRYVSRAQSLAFQFALDRLTALDLIAWVREPAAIHVTAGGRVPELLPLLRPGAPSPAR